MVIGRAFTRQTFWGVVSALGLSGSIYFVVKQATPATPTTSVTISSFTHKSEESLDLVDAISHVKDVTINDIDTIFQLLNEMKENGVTPTLKELLEHKDKLGLIIQLLKQCDEESKKTTADNICKFNNKDEGKKFLALFLAHADKIKQILDEDKKALEASKAKDPTFTREPINELKAMQRLIEAYKLSKAQEASEAMQALLQELQAMIAKESSSDPELQKNIASLLSFYTSKTPAAKVP